MSGMTEVAHRRGNELQLSADAEFWTDRQIASLRQIGVESASNAELAVFHHVCQRTGLDPFSRQIYMIKRDGKQVIQTGIDGLRLVARRAVDRSKETLSIGAPEWCDAAGRWSDVWLADEAPAAARVTVLRDGQPFPAIALWREYVQTTFKDGKQMVTKMWRTRPAGQLAKCAEALALRKAFPQDLSGVYAPEEIDQHSVVHGDVVQERPRRVTVAEIQAQAQTPTATVSPSVVAVQGDVAPGSEPPGTASSHEPPGDVDSPPTPTSPGSPDEGAEWRPRQQPATNGQLTKIRLTFNGLGLVGEEYRESRLSWTGRIVGRDIDSSTELGVDEASTVIDTLGRVGSLSDLEALLESGELS